jgi:hypothetical protein
MPRSYFSRIVRGQGGEALQPPRPIATLWKSARIESLATRPAASESAPNDRLWRPGFPVSSQPGWPAAAAAYLGHARRHDDLRPSDSENRPEVRERSESVAALAPFEAASQPDTESKPSAPIVHTDPNAVGPKRAKMTERPFTRMDRAQLTPALPRHRTPASASAAETPAVPARPPVLAPSEVIPARGSELTSAGTTRAATRIPVLDPLVAEHSSARMPADRAPEAAPKPSSAPAERNLVEIGKLEVNVIAPPQRPAAPPTRARLARGYALGPGW